jgi:hypothetical protein
VRERVADIWPETRFPTPRVGEMQKCGQRAVDVRAELHETSVRDGKGMKSFPMKEKFAVHARDLRRWWMGWGVHTVDDKLEI